MDSSRSHPLLHTPSQRPFEVPAQVTSPFASQVVSQFSSHGSPQGSSQIRSQASPQSFSPTLVQTSTQSPSTPNRHRPLTRDQRLQVLTLSTAGHTHQFIADHLSISRRQVGYAISNGCLTPKKSSGRRTRLGDEQIDELINFVQTSSTGKHMSYLELAAGPFEHWHVSEAVIRRALKSRGYECKKTNTKTPPSRKKKTNTTTPPSEKKNMNKESQDFAYLNYLPTQLPSFDN